MDPLDFSYQQIIGTFTIKQVVFDDQIFLLPEASGPDKMIQRYTVIAL